jgi:hypothetical protein
MPIRQVAKLTRCRTVPPLGECVSLFAIFGILNLSRSKGRSSERSTNKSPRSLSP